MDASTCPGKDTECQTRTCNAGVCGLDFKPNGTPTPTQTPSDCKTAVCDGSGGLTTNDDPADVLDDQNPCTTDSCDAGNPVNKPSPSGTACNAGGGKVCDGQGACVECVVPADCASSVCQSNKCVAATCADAVKNGTETDIDCGGATCAPCADGKVCAVAADCTSGVCTGNVCKTPICSDGVKNGAETDMDCGGPTCPPCADGKTCVAGADCTSKVCTGGVCQVPTCSDGVKNAAETDVDCGGPVCGDCGPGQGCMVPSDCTSQLCTGGVCAAPACGDGVFLPPEACDDSNVNNGDGCSATCTVDAGYTCSGSPSVCTTTCGDGIKAGAEACDDNNMMSGDGCSAACAVEAGYSCAGSPSVCAPICGDMLKVGNEQCDDGNVVNNDCCSSTCQIEAGCEIELNNTIATANNFGALSVGSKIKGFITPAAEKDYFLITVPAGLTWTLNAQTIDNFLGVLCTAQTIDSELTIFDANAVQLATNDDIDVATNWCSSVTAAGLAPGQYYVEVMSHNGGSSFAYTMQVSLTFVPCGDNIIQAGEQCDDGNTNSGDGCSSTCKLEPVPEAEPNGTCAQANGPVVLGSAVNSSKLVGGTITPANDNDWYGFTIPVYADVRFETFDSSGPGSCSPSTVDTEIQVFASDCTTPVTPIKDQGGILNCSKIDPSADTQVRHLAPGTYYVKVSPWSASATFGYSLHVTMLSSCGNNITEGFEQCDGGANCDATCLLIPACGDGTVNGTEICDDGNTNNGDGCSSTCKFEGFTNEIEPNNTTAQADANGILITGNSLYVGSIGATGDKDYYKVTLAAQSTVRFETFETQSPSDCPAISTTLRLFNSVGAQIKIDNPDFGASGINSCAALVVNLAAGTYYIQVERTGNTGPITKYFLETKIEADTGAEMEPNETSAQANPFPGTDMFKLGGHPAAADLDWYQVTVPAGMSIRAEVIEGDIVETCESNGVDSQLTLYDAAAVELVTNDDDGRGYCSAIDGTGATPYDAAAHNLSGGTYYLQVRSSSFAAPADAVFNYRLVATIR